MFSQLSTDNLLDNLEDELTELIELDSPKIVKKSSPAHKKTPTKIPTENSFQLPVPAKRNLFDVSPEKFPVPAARKNHSLDKKEKNDENEIIQMTVLHSDHASSDIEHFPRESSGQLRQSVIVIDEKRKEKTNQVKIVHESDKISHEESFIVIKHGKWADEDKNEQEIEEIKEKVEAVPEKVFKPALEVISENPKKKKSKPKEEQKTSISSMASETQKTNTESSSIEESPKPKKKIKRSEKKAKHRKKKTTSEEVTLTSASSKRSALKKDATSSEKSIGKKISRT